MGISVIDNVELDCSDPTDIEIVKEAIQEEYMDYELSPERAKDFWEDEVLIKVNVDNYEFEFNEKPCNWYNSIKEFAEDIAV